jgi:AcrR family transcriptional regulator
VSSQLSTIPRRSLNARQAETVERLLAAATEELERAGHEALTIRAVAQRAGVSPATAYSYVASRDHLFAELFWRLLTDAGEPRLTGRTPTRRLQQTVRHLAELIAGSPATAAAATKSLLGSDPQVERLRLRIGTLFLDRFRAALGDDVAPHVLETVMFAFFGGLLQAGMGVFSYEELARRLDDVVAVILAGTSPAGVAPGGTP